MSRHPSQLADSDHEKQNWLMVCRVAPQQVQTNIRVQLSKVRWLVSDQNITHVAATISRGGRQFVGIRGDSGGADCALVLPGRLPPDGGVEGRARRAGRSGVDRAVCLWSARVRSPVFVSLRRRLWAVSGMLDCFARDLFIPDHPRNRP